MLPGMWTAMILVRTAALAYTSVTIFRLWLYSLYIGGEDVGPNPKICNMMPGYRDAQYPLMWFSDSRIHSERAQPTLTTRTLCWPIHLYSLSRQPNRNDVSHRWPKRRLSASGTRGDVTWCCKIVSSLTDAICESCGRICWIPWQSELVWLHNNYYIHTSIAHDCSISACFEVRRDPKHVLTLLPCTCRRTLGPNLHECISSEIY